MNTIRALEVIGGGGTEIFGVNVSCVSKELSPGFDSKVPQGTQFTEEL